MAVRRLTGVAGRTRLALSEAQTADSVGLRLVRRLSVRLGVPVGPAPIAVVQVLQGVRLPVAERRLLQCLQVTLPAALQVLAVAAEGVRPASVWWLAVRYMLATRPARVAVFR